MRSSNNFVEMTLKLVDANRSVFLLEISLRFIAAVHLLQLRCFDTVTCVIKVSDQTDANISWPHRILRLVRTSYTRKCSVRPCNTDNLLCTEQVCMLSWTNLSLIRYQTQEVPKSNWRGSAILSERQEILSFLLIFLIHLYLCEDMKIVKLPCRFWSTRTPSDASAKTNQMRADVVMREIYREGRHIRDYLLRVILRTVNCKSVNMQ